MYLHCKLAWTNYKTYTYVSVTKYAFQHNKLHVLKSVCYTLLLWLPIHREEIEGRYEDGRTAEGNEGEDKRKEERNAYLSAEFKPWDNGTTWSAPYKQQKLDLNAGTFEHLQTTQSLCRNGSVIKAPKSVSLTNTGCRWRTVQLIATSLHLNHVVGKRVRQLNNSQQCLADWLKRVNAGREWQQ